VSTPTEILKLVDKFACNPEAYKKSTYNEEQVRIEFINPFFAKLGWDIANEQHNPEKYKDVIHEDAIKIGGTTKAPDYCFRIGGMRKFFVEAKKPAINLKDDISPAYQLRRYGWNAKLPLSILTDFEEFVVYDCRFMPILTDNANTARALYFKYTDYAQCWDEIASLFSRDAVLKGSFDRYVEETKTKRGSTEVDTVFLKEIERWRDMLARNIALRNPSLTQRELNFAVQLTVDRIIFLRICEDRGIEPYGKLNELQRKEQVYKCLFQFFKQADDRYNSGLFYFQLEKGHYSDPDYLTPGLTIDDNVLKDILKSLYSPSPYEFSVIPADILGQIYEQFLGKVIRLTPAHRAVVEEKLEVKKAGGVYYTPTYIVDYIIKNTIEKLLEDKTPEQVPKLRILDPACGSGSFLMSAYQCLLDWHHNQYVNSADSHKWSRGKQPRIYQVQGGEYRLTTSERKRILLNNIYGVDIDPQAVEVTKLSLLLKVLELDYRQLSLLEEQRALPDLGNNIKCGNSLISTDFYDDQQMSFLDYEERYKINVFDWKAEFPEIMQGDGFDVVIGNPPWGGDIDKITSYIEIKYPQSTQGYKDSFKLFIEKGIRLVRPEGLLSFIVPSAFMFQPRYLDIRRLLMQLTIQKLWNVGDKVFGPRVTAPACIFIVSKKAPPPNAVVQVLDTSYTHDNLERMQSSQSPTYRRLPQELYKKTTQETFIAYHRELGSKEVHLFEVIDCKDCGIKHQRVGCGMEQKGKSDLSSRLYYEGPQRSPQDHKFLIGADLNKFRWNIDYSRERYFVGNYMSILHKDEIVYFNEDVFNLAQKIVWRQTSDRIRAAITGRHWFANTLQAGILLDDNYDLRYVLGLLNSRFLNFVYIESVKESGRVFPQVKLGKMRALPFRTINFSDPTDKARHDRIVSLVEQMLELHKQLLVIKTGHERKVLQRQIDSTSDKIDVLVYDLYDLSEEEIEIIK